MTLATAYPTWLVMLAWFVLLSPTLPGILMVSAAISGPGPQPNPLMRRGLVALALGAIASWSLYRYLT